MNFHTLSDGNHTEGIGALLQYQLFCYGFCKLNNFNFRFDGFKNLQHFQYTNQTQREFSNTVTTFCGLPVCNDLTNSKYLEPQFIMKYGQENIEKIVPLLKNLNLVQLSPVYYDTTKFNVAVHIRMFTKTDSDAAQVREYFNQISIYEIEKYYSKISGSLGAFREGKEVVYHIYSQGDIEEFQIFKNIFHNVEFYVAEHPIISLYHMMSADVFVMGNSSLSYVAHLYGRNKCIAKSSFYHSLYKPNIIQ